MITTIKYLEVVSFCDVVLQIFTTSLEAGMFGNVIERTLSGIRGCDSAGIEDQKSSKKHPGLWDVERDRGRWIMKM